MRTNQLNLVNQTAWSQDKGLRNWMRNIRLDAFTKLAASVAPTETDKINILGQLRAQHGGGDEYSGSCWRRVTHPAAIGVHQVRLAGAILLRP